MFQPERKLLYAFTSGGFFYQHAKPHALIFLRHKKIGYISYPPNPPPYLVGLTYFKFKNIK